MKHINSFKINEAVMFFFITMIISIPKNDIRIRSIPYTPDALRKNTLRPIYNRVLQNSGKKNRKTCRIKPGSYFPTKVRQAQKFE